MTAIITKALTSGFTPEQIIKLLIKKFPQYSQKIERAMAAGFGAEQILKFITKGDKGGVGSQEEATTLHEQTGELENKRRSNVNKTALGIAAMAGSAALPYVAPELLNTAGTMLGGIVPRGTNQGIQPTPSPQVMTPGQQIGQQVHQPGVTPNVPVPPQQPQPITQEQINTSPEYQPEYDFLAKRNLIPKLQTMAKAGKSKEQMVEFLKKKIPMMEQEYLRTLGPGGREVDLDTKLGNIVDQYITQQKSPVPMAQEMPELANEEHKPLIATKSGDIGEVKGEDSSGKLIDVNGKVRKFKDDEIIESPIPEKDLADLYDDLIGGIQGETGQEVSRNVYWAGYDPKTNELLYIPHGGRAYNYDDISPEDVEELTNLLSRRKTSGENYIGAWVEGTQSPIGAAMHKLIMKLQKARGGKGNEYKNRFETIYDALEPAKIAAKRKHAKRKK